MDSPRYFSEHEPLRRTKNRLPHWEQERCACFVTFRLGDSLPQERQREWENEREAGCGIIRNRGRQK
jgi:putative transposase